MIYSFSLPVSAVAIQRTAILANSINYDHEKGLLTTKWQSTVTSVTEIEKAGLIASGNHLIWSNGSIEVILQNGEMLKQALDKLFALIIENPLPFDSKEGEIELVQN